MIVDREGDLVILKGKGFRLDVGGFLMEPTPKELMDRVDAACTLMMRMYDSAEADHLSIPPKEPAVTCKFNGQPVNLEVEQTVSLDGTITLTAAQAEKIDQTRFFKAVEILPLPDLTEQQQLDSCTGR